MQHHCVWLHLDLEESNSTLDAPLYCVWLHLDLEESNSTLDAPLYCVWLHLDLEDSNSTLDAPLYCGYKRSSGSAQKICSGQSRTDGYGDFSITPLNSLQDV